MISFLAGLVYANAGEWFIHKYVLHGIGKNKDSMWSFHWREHHRASRKNDMIDAAYGPLDPVEDTHGTSSGLTAQEKETLGLCTLSAVHLPLFFVSPGFAFGVMTSIGAYYFLHKKSHLTPGWAKRWMPWHYDHHMGKNQDANWCVTFPLFDWIMRTREKMK